MKVFVLFLSAYLLLGCGVDTSSSSSSLQQSDGSTNTDGTTTDTGTTTDENDTTGTNDGGTTVIVDESTSAGFSQADAELDVNACIINGTFQAISDSSFDPNSIADSANGLEIASQYPYSTDLEATKVALFYPTLKSLPLDQVIHIYEDNYRLSFDKAWSSNDIPKVYIRTPKDSNGAYSCYRYDLDSINGDTITKTKVYR